MNAPFWTADRVAQLCERHGSGASMAKIARELGITRNACIGKWNRLQERARRWSEQDIGLLCGRIAREDGFDEIAADFEVDVEEIRAVFAIVRRGFGRQAL